MRSCVIRSSDVDVRIDGRLIRTASLNDEYYAAAPDPLRLCADLKASGAGVDLVTFVQELHDPEPRFPYEMSWDRMAVLRLTTYQHWFDTQIKFKPRNKLRKAWKNGVETRLVPLTDALVHGIVSIYNETPLRQGKRNWHYGKGFDVIRQEHSTFLDRSDFIGAYWKDELIGFSKVTHGEHYSVVMNIVAKIAHRDKAPMNALVAKAVESVAARKIPLLNYGVWGRRGLNDFKVASAFECLAVPRYYVPLTWRGALTIRLGAHRGLRDRLPEPLIVKAADLRTRWNEWRHGDRMVRALATKRLPDSNPSGD